MAEAAVEHTPAAGRFFCHACSQEVNPVLPDYICSRCNSGFIEELVQPNPEPVLSEEDEDARTFAHITDVIIRSIQGNDVPLRGPARTNTSWSRAGPSRRPYRGSSGQRGPAQQQADPRNRAEGFLQQFIQSLSENTGFVPNTNFPVFVNLPGNPGDYVWGRGGWNAIITQLINQLDGTGPPPLPKEKIEEIPTVEITESHVESNLQCSVCMEDFILKEPVRLLPCLHHFHNDCIIPWLQLHGTCPICRKNLMPDSGLNPISSDSTYALNPEPGPSGARTDSTSSSQLHNDSLSRNSQNDPSAYDFNDDWD